MAKISRGDGVVGGGMIDGIEMVDDGVEVVIGMLARGVEVAKEVVGDDGVFSDLIRNGRGRETVVVVVVSVEDSGVSGVVMRDVISSSLDDGLMLETLTASLFTDADDVDEADDVVASADLLLNSFLLLANQLETTCGETTSFGIKLTPFLSNCNK